MVNASTLIAFFALIGTILGGGFWAYMTRRLDLGTSRLDALDKELKEANKEIANLKEQQIYSNARYEALEDRILNMIEFRLHDRDAWFGLASEIRERRKNGGVLTRTATIKRKQHVLVVDDEKDTTEMLATSLKLLGYDARTANNGPDALQQFSSMRNIGQPFDLVLLDYAMPTMDGVEVVQKIREKEDPYIPPVKICFLTGNIEQLREKDKAEPFLERFCISDLLSKPLELNELKQRIATILDE